MNNRTEMLPFMADNNVSYFNLTASILPIYVACSSSYPLSYKSDLMKKLITSPTIVGTALLTAILACSGCGQKGALYLPDASDSQAVVTPTAENTNLDDLDKLDSLTKSNELDNSDNNADDLSFLNPATEQQILDDPNNY